MLEVWENKGDLPRSVPMTRRVAELVARRMHGLTLFFDVPAEGGRGVAPGAGRPRPVRRQAAGAPCLPAHCASRLVQRGASLYAVQKVLGHSNIKVTERYSHLNPEVLRPAPSLCLNVTRTKEDQLALERGDADARP